MAVEFRIVDSTIFINILQFCSAARLYDKPMNVGDFLIKPKLDESDLPNPLKKLIQVGTYLKVFSLDKVYHHLSQNL